MYYDYLNYNSKSGPLPTQLCMRSVCVCVCVCVCACLCLPVFSASRAHFSDDCAKQHHVSVDAINVVAFTDVSTG